MTALMDDKNLPQGPIESNVAGIIIKQDGTFQVFNTFENVELATQDPRKREMIEQAMALAVALRVPQVLDLLKNLANDPDVFSEALKIGQLRH